MTARNARDSARRRAPALLFLLLVLLPTAALGLCDSRGAEIADQAPQRVVCLYGSYAEAWTLAGGTLCGVTDDAVSERGMGIGNLLFYRQQVCQRQLTPDVGDVNFNHVLGHVLSKFTRVYGTAKSRQTQVLSPKLFQAKVPPPEVSFFSSKHWHFSSGYV